MNLTWEPKPGDRIRTVISKDCKNELVFLNGDHAITSLVTDEFLILTSEWVPWPHQIIDSLSQLRGLDRRTLLRMLVKLDEQHKELDFDQLCQQLLATWQEVEDKRSELEFSSMGHSTSGQ